MSETNQFRQYAEEALGWVAQALTEKEKRTLIELACTWAQAAAESERTRGRQLQGLVRPPSVGGPRPFAWASPTIH
jgi:hypothetical protein